MKYFSITDYFLCRNIQQNQERFTFLKKFIKIKTFIEHSSTIAPKKIMSLRLSYLDDVQFNFAYYVQNTNYEIKS